MKVKVYYYTAVEVDIEDAVVEEYRNNDFHQDVESFREYHERELKLEENIWKEIERATGMSFCDYKDGEIAGVYEVETGADIIVY